MKAIETSRCREFGQPEFRVCVEHSGVLQADIDFFMRTLEEWVQAGERFKNGETVQFGWSVLMVRANSDDTLSLLEPDFCHMPIQWVDSVTSTIRHLRLQKDVCESFFDAETANFPSLRYPCIVCTRVQEARDVVMERHEPDDLDSGWFLGCLREDHDHEDAQQLSRVSLYEAVLQNPAALPYVALPPGAMLHVGDGEVRALFHDGERLQPRKGSYCEALAKGRPTSA
jgi:hypothetical protein